MKQTTEQKIRSIQKELIPIEMEGGWLVEALKIELTRLLKKVEDNAKRNNS